MLKFFSQTINIHGVLVSNTLFDIMREFTDLLLQANSCLNVASATRASYGRPTWAVSRAGSAHPPNTETEIHKLRKEGQNNARPLQSKPNATMLFHQIALPGNNVESGIINVRLPIYIITFLKVFREGRSHEVTD